MTSFKNTGSALPPGRDRGPAWMGTPAPGTLLTRRLPVGSTTLDREARTVTATIASSTPVQRPGPAPDGSPGSWTEILSIDASAVDTSRLIGAPVLLGHNQTRDNHVGAVIAARIEAGRIVAELKLSGRADVEPILADIADGVLRQVSAGYRVERWRKTPAGFLAERWQPLEVSLLPLAADGECLIRSFSNQEASMPDTITNEIQEASSEQASTWSAAEALELNRSAASLRVPPAIVDDAFARGLSVDQTRRALISAAAERDERVETRPHRIEGGVSYDDPASIRSRMCDAILHRANPGAFPLSDRAREFRGLSLADMKGRLLEARGVRTRGLTADEILTRADIGGLHTTSDFPLLLADALHKELDRQIKTAETPLKALSRERTASDFRTLYVNRVGNASGLERVNEAGEFKRGTWGEEREAFALGTYGRIWGITRQVLVNDDLSFFTDIAEEAALAVAELEAGRFVALLVGAGGLGAVVSDGKTAFHADHDNVGTASAPDVASLSEARQLLRAQKGVGGLHLLGSTPRTIVVPSALETTAEQLVAGITAAVVEEANPFAGKLNVAVEPRLASATRWYIAAEAPFFAHAYLEGNRSAQVATREGFDVDGVEFRVRHDFGACIRDWRLAVTNAGAGG